MVRLPRCVDTFLWNFIQNYPHPKPYLEPPSLPSTFQPKPLSPPPLVSSRLAHPPLAIDCWGRRRAPIVVPSIHEDKGDCNGRPLMTSLSDVPALGGPRHEVARGWRCRTALSWPISIFHVHLRRYVHLRRSVRWLNLIELYMRNK